MHHDLCCLLSILGGSYHLNFAQHLRSVMSRRRSDPIWLPEEPFVPTHCPASVKFFCLFGLMGKKFTLRSIGDLPGFPKAAQLLLGEAASMLCSGHPRTEGRLTLSWLPLLTCGGVQVHLCAQQRCGEPPTTAPSLLLPAQDTLRVPSPGSGETVPWQWEAAGTEQSLGCVHWWGCHEPGIVTE